MGWEPLLDGSLADAARRMARDIACEVARPVGSAVDRTVFWAYASTAFDESFVETSYNAALDELVEGVLAGVASPMLYDGGLAGIGWTLAHVLDGDGDGLLPRIDRTMLDVVSISPWGGKYDLAHGLVGYGVYFLERLRSGPEPIAREGLARVVDQLATLAIRTADGVTWRTAAELLPDHQRARWPTGCHDCGVAHGQAGAIALLARAAGIDDPPDGAATLCEDATRWLVAQRGAANEVGGRFPTFGGEGVAFEPSRTAWCYGDLGVAIALWRVEAELGLACGLARETALDCATRTPARCQVVDAALCHGSAGLAHLCNRFFQASGDPTFRDAAQQWFAATLACDGVAGLPGYEIWGDQPFRLIDGAIGVGLALVAAITPTEPGWDRLLLADLP